MNWFAVFNLLNCLKGNHALEDQAHSCLKRTHLWPDCPTHSLLHWLCVSGFRLVIVMILTTSGSTMSLFWRQRLWSTAQHTTTSGTKAGLSSFAGGSLRMWQPYIVPATTWKVGDPASWAKPAPTVSRSSAVGKAISFLKILKTALLILGTMSCTEELGMSKASDSTQYDAAVCAYCL